jgi:hypothetical protein
MSRMILLHPLQVAGLDTWCLCLVTATKWTCGLKTQYPSV